MTPSDGSSSDRTRPTSAQLAQLQAYFRGESGLSPVIDTCTLRIPKLSENRRLVATAASAPPDRSIATTVAAWADGTVDIQWLDMGRLGASESAAVHAAIHALDANGARPPVQLITWSQLVADTTARRFPFRSREPVVKALQARCARLCPTVMHPTLDQLSNGDTRNTMAHVAHRLAYFADHARWDGMHHTTEFAQFVTTVAVQRMSESELKSVYDSWRSNPDLDRAELSQSIRRVLDTVRAGGTADRTTADRPRNTWSNPARTPGAPGYQHGRGAGHTTGPEHQRP